jgi:hypothetical protein
MQAKLTLKLDENAVVGAKKYAVSTHQSLSSIVEGYFMSLAHRATGVTRKPTPIVNALSGSIKGSRDRHLSDEYTEYLQGKYNR